MKFLITRADGIQYVHETDTSHSQLLLEFPPTTDILPIQEAGASVDAESVEEVVKPKKAKAK